MELDEPNKKNALIFGAGDTGAHLLTYLRRFAPVYSIVGFIDDDPKKLKNSLMGINVLGNRNAIADLSKSHGVKEVGRPLQCW